MKSNQVYMAAILVLVFCADFAEAGCGLFGCRFSGGRVLSGRLRERWNNRISNSARPVASGCASCQAFYLNPASAPEADQYHAGVILAGPVVADPLLRESLAIRAVARPIKADQPVLGDGQRIQPGK